MEAEAIASGYVKREERSDEREYLTPLDLAQAAGITRRSAYSLIHNGDIPAAKVGGQWWIRRSDLDALFHREGR